MNTPQDEKQQSDEAMEIAEAISMKLHGKLHPTAVAEWHDFIRPHLLPHPQPRDQHGDTEFKIACFLDDLDLLAEDVDPVETVAAHLRKCPHIAHPQPPGVVEQMNKAMDLLNRAADSLLDRPAPENWWKDYYLLIGTHMICTENGWEHGGVKDQYSPSEIWDEVNAPSSPPAAPKTTTEPPVDSPTAGTERCDSCDHVPGPIAMPKDLPGRLIWSCPCKCHLTPSASSPDAVTPGDAGGRGTTND
jgi:hypothetical protein